MQVDEHFDFQKVTIGVSYVLRATNGLIKIGFTTKALEGLRQRFLAHCKDERTRGRTAPEFLGAFESSKAFDNAIIERLYSHQTDFSKDWFHPTPQVLSVVTRLLAEARNGLTPTVYTQAETATHAKESNAFIFLLTHFFELPLSLGSRAACEKFGGVDAILALKQAFTSKTEAVDGLDREILEKQRLRDRLRAALSAEVVRDLENLSKGTS